MNEIGKNQDHLRSNFVITSVSKWEVADLKDIVPQAQALPITLRCQGLMVTLARLAGSENGSVRMLKEMLFDWLAKRAPSKWFDPHPATIPRMLERMEEMDRTTYLSIQQEALLLSERIKLITKAFETGRKGE